MGRHNATVYIQISTVHYLINQGPNIHTLHLVGGSLKSCLLNLQVLFLPFYSLLPCSDFAEDTGLGLLQSTGSPTFGWGLRCPQLGSPFPPWGPQDLCLRPGSFLMVSTTINGIKS